MNTKNKKSNNLIYLDHKTNKSQMINPLPNLKKYIGLKFNKLMTKNHTLKEQEDVFIFLISDYKDG